MHLSSPVTPMRYCPLCDSIRSEKLDFCSFGCSNLILFPGRSSDSLSCCSCSCQRCVQDITRQQNNTIQPTLHENPTPSHSLQSAPSVVATLMSLHCWTGPPASGRLHRRASSRLHLWSSAPQDIGKVQPCCCDECCLVKGVCLYFFSACL
jgi:hypothetical protein